MGLKVLKLQKKLELRRATWQELLSKDEAFKTRSADLAKAIEEAENDEDLTLVEEQVTKHEADTETHEDAKTTLENEIRQLETELSDLESKEPEQRGQQSQPQQQTRANNNTFAGGTENMKYGKLQQRAAHRAAIQSTINDQEVRSFYEKLRDVVKDKRSISGLDLTIPTVVLDRIQPLIGQSSKLYDEVEVIELNGEGRAIVDGSIPEAIWTEMAGAVEEMQDAFEAVEIDGYKVGGFIPVANAYLEDTMINLALHIENRIARSIGKALDKAILIGTGSVNKQPEGIIPAITATKKTSPAQLGTLLSHLGDVDAGEEDENEVIAVMTRKTYYKHIMPQTVVNTADGRQVVGDVKNPNIAGLRVKLVSYMPPNAVLFGAFKKYILGERKGVQVVSSTEVRFIQDQTVIKGTARYDGKPANTEAFQLVELSDVDQPAGA